MNTLATPEAIGWLGEFKDKEFESKFRHDTLDNARRLVIAAALSILLASITLATNDIGKDGIDPAVMWARNAQGLIALFSCWLAWWRPSWRTVYAATWLLAAGVIVATIVIDLSRPSDYLLHLALDILIIMGIYIAVPSVRVQMLVAGCFSFVLVWMVLTQKSPQYDMALRSAPIAVFLANFLGLTMSLLYNRVKRQFYAQADVERHMRESLEAAHQEVEKLSALLPICSSCKNVRDDEGYWYDVETYMEALSGQRVSHGICPDCATRLYGENPEQPEL